MTMRFVILASALLLSLVFSMPNSTTAFVAKPVGVYLQCTCPEETNPEPKTRHYSDLPNYEFSWISDADEIRDANGKPTSRWCYFTGFKNLNHDYVVSVDFPEAGISANVSKN